MHCRKCGSEVFVKNGFVAGVQRYKCKKCGFQFTRETPHGKPMKDKILALIKIGKPPALLGDSQSLTFRAMKKTSILEPFKVSGKEVISGSSKPKPFNMGMQLSCGMDTQIQEEENIQGNTDRFGNCSA